MEDRTLSDDLAMMSATDLVARYRTVRLSPVEVVRAVLDRIDAGDALLNAFCFRDDTAAMKAARESEARWRSGTPLGLLDGVPAAIKDQTLAKGWRTLRGSLTISPDQPWDEDSPAVARMREHGAVFVGKTTLPEFAWKGVTDSPLTGVTRNPWNPEKTPGGSSGGAAAAAAVGMGALHIGSDGGGSIRIPCAFTGVFGIKPSFGLVPLYPPVPVGTLAHVGPLTRTVSDSALMLTVIALPDPEQRDWFAMRHQPRDYRVGLESGVHGLRVAYSRTLGYAEVEAEVAELVDKAVRVFESLGAVIEDVDPGFETPEETFRVHFFGRLGAVGEGLTAEQRALLDPGLQEVMEIGKRYTPRDWFVAEAEREVLGRYMNLFMTKYDLLMTPQLPLVAFEVDAEVPAGRGMSRWVDWTPFTYPFNLTQQPAASVPCGVTSEGLPVALQIVAAKYRDDLVLSASRAYESVHPFLMPPLPW